MYGDVCLLWIVSISNYDKCCRLKAMTGKSTAAIHLTSSQPQEDSGDRFKDSLVAGTLSRCGEYFVVETC